MTVPVYNKGETESNGADVPNSDIVCTFIVNCIAQSLLYFSSEIVSGILSDPSFKMALKKSNEITAVIQP